MSLCKICDLPDWDAPEFLVILDELRLSFGRETKHRKHWEFVQALRGLRRLGCLTPEAVALGVAAGHEHPIYYLANTIRKVIATDIYGHGDFSSGEAPAGMLTHPEQFAPFPYRQDHLAVEFVDALELKYPDDSFDIVFSLSSVEHFGGHSASGRAVQGMARVLRPGGILVLTTEVILNRAPHPEFFLPEELNAFLVLPSGLQLVEEIDFTITPTLLEHPLDLSTDISHAFPHIVLKDHLTLFTSVIMFLRKPLSGWVPRDLPGAVPGPARAHRLGLDHTLEVIQHNKQREAEAVSRKSTAVEGKSEGEWLLKLPFAGRGMSNIRLSTGEMFNFAVSVMALDPAPGDLVLDLGAGSCWVSEWLNRLLVATVSLDYAHDMLAIGQQRLEPGAKLTVGDFEKLPFADGTFDGAICLSALHHVPDIPAALREICRVLKPDGAAVFSEPGAGHSAHPQSRAEMAELGVLERDIVVNELLDECLTAGFNSVHVQPYLLPPPIYNYETWHNMEQATGLVSMAQASFPQTLSGVIRAALAVGRMGWNRLMASVPGLRRSSSPGQPANASEAILGWQSLLAFRNAVCAHPLVIARKALRIPDSRRPGVLNAEIVITDAPTQTPCGAPFTIQVQVRNTGDTLWLHKPSSLGGHVALGAKLVDDGGLALIYDYSRGVLPIDVAPGEVVSVEITVAAPAVPGHYQVKLDMVDELVVWFEHRGARPVFVPFEVVSEQP